MTVEATLSGRQAPAPAGSRLAVIDTNVWLDLYFFRDPDSQPLAAALDSPHWIAARSEQTEAELAAVLQRPRFGSNPGERSLLLECVRQWQDRTSVFPFDAAAPWRCRDPHDQKFLDLAFAAQATVLLTKDKALLALNRKAQHVGLTIITPRDFGRRFGLGPALRPGDSHPAGLRKPTLPAPRSAKPAHRPARGGGVA